jgi:hypothetical protein
MYVVSGASIDVVISGGISARALDVNAVAINLSGDISVTSVFMSSSATIISGQGFVDELYINNNDEVEHNVDVRYISGAVARGLIQTTIPRGASLTYKPRVGWHVEGSAVGSGWVTSGMLSTDYDENIAILSGSIGSGQVGYDHFVSGSIGSGDFGNASVLSGSIPAADIFDNHFRSGAKIDAAEYCVADGLITAERISGRRCVTVNSSGQMVMAMAGKSGRFPAIGIVVDNVESGYAARRFHKGRVYAQNNIFNFSGGMGTDPLWLGISGEIVVSNQLPGGSGLSQVIGVSTFQSGMIVDYQIGFTISGLVTRFAIGSGQVESGVIASGQISLFQWGSGALTSAHYADASISTYKFVYFSGTIGQFGSGSTSVTYSNNNVDEILKTEEAISGGHPINISQSGYARIAMAGVSGRMPAVGVLNVNVTSGATLTVLSGNAPVYLAGYVANFAPGVMPVDNFGARMYVGFSGGFYLSSQLVSGMVIQFIGINYASGEMRVRIDPVITSGLDTDWLGVT